MRDFSDITQELVEAKVALERIRADGERGVKTRGYWTPAESGRLSGAMLRCHLLEMELAHASGRRSA